MKRSYETRDQSEGELIALMRGDDDDQFTLTVTRVASIWTVMTERVGKKTIGTGATFDEAWRRQEPAWVD